MATGTDARVRKASAPNQEDIGYKSQVHLIKEHIPDIKPGIDLIPDEFPRDVNSNILVELVCGETDESAQELQECLEHFGYSVTKTDKDRERMAEEINEQWVNNVIQKINQNKYDGLIMVFAKVLYSNAKITKLWSKFTAQICPELKNKPKIFIFQIPRAIEADNTATSLGWKSSYETPAEADILIIHDIVYDQKDDLLDLLATGIKDYGTKEDIFTLASMSYEYDYQPLIISTMTRKFYFRLNEHRGHHFSFQRNYEGIKQELDKIKNKLEAKSTEKKPRNSSFRQVLKKTFSFRNGKKNTKSEDNNGAVAMDGAAIAEEVTDEPKKTRSPEKANHNIPKKEDNKEILKPPLKTLRSPPPSSGAVRKKSTSSEFGSQNLEKRFSKTKTPSVSSESGSVKKPAWKP